MHVVLVSVLVIKIRERGKSEKDVIISLEGEKKVMAVGYNG